MRVKAKRPEISPSQLEILSKRGGKVQRSAERQDLNAIKLVITDSGELKTVMVRKPTDGNCAFIDGIRFTVGVETFHRTEKGTLLTDGQIIMEASIALERVFGFGITGALGHGRDFYDQCWTLGEDLGYVAMGGKNQQGTMLVCIHGSGAMSAMNDWETRLYNWLSGCSRPSITRVDLAHDCFDGSYWNCDYADRAYDHGWWSAGHRAPSHEYRGNWKRPDGSGRTLYIGKRKNGKLCRTYEKGKQLGDQNSEWVRCEVEVHNRDRVIPLDVLLDPSGYFLGQYPALQVIEPEGVAKRIRIAQRATQITVDKCLDNVRRSYGAYIRVLRMVMDDDVLLDQLQRHDESYPSRLKTTDETRYLVPIHRAPDAIAESEKEHYGVF